MNTFEKDAAYIAATYKRFPVEIIGGSGSTVTDADGKTYTDLGTGIAVNIFGLCDEIWTTAVKKQLNAFAHTSNLYYSAPCADLAALLCQKTGMKKVFFGNSGAEANECAIKACRAYAAQKHGADTYQIITLQNSFHGRTITTLAATGQDVFHKDFLPLTPGFLTCEANDIDALRKLVSENKIAGILFELIQGEGGVNPLEPSFVSAMAALAAERDILLLDDEVQAGNGRSGALYTYMKYGITPDLVTTAKGLGGGLPIGVCLFGEKTADVLKAGMHGSTFGGNPVCAAGALSILSRLDAPMLAGVEERSSMIFEALQGQKGIESVSGMGLMVGIKTAAPAADIVIACREKGVLLLTAKDKIRLLPALNIPKEQLTAALEIIKTACATCAEGMEK